MSSTVDPNIVKSIPPALLKTLPAGQPPKGIKPNFADPPTRVPEILGVCTAFIVLTLVCFAIRIYTKLAIAKEWKWDDCKWCSRKAHRVMEGTLCLIPLLSDLLLRLGELFSQGT